MNGKTVSDVNPNVLKPTRKEIIEREKKMRTQYVSSKSPSTIRLRPEKNASSTPPPPAVIAVNRLVDARSAIAFLQEQHAEVLKGLHQQVEDLQKQCKDLQFSLTLQLPYLSDEDRSRITNLEMKLHDKEKECNELREELLRNEHKIHKLKREIHLKDQIEKQLKKDLERSREMLNNQKLLLQNEISKRDQQQQQQQQPIPPPKDGRFRASVRPAALYRRLLGFGVRSLKENSCSPSPPPVESPPNIDLDGSIQSTSSIPQLPRLVGSNSSPLRQRPLIRQQLRVSSLGSGENQTLSIDQNPLNSSYRTADQNPKNTY